MAGPARDQAAAILSVVQDVLGPDIVAAYLYGSAVDGGLRPRSDIDVLVVSRRPTTTDEKRRLVATLAPISRRGRRPEGWRPAEVTVVARRHVRPWSFPPRVDFQYGEWLVEEFDRGEFEPAPSAHGDLAIVLAMVLRRSEALVGPPAADVIDPVPRGDLVRAMVTGIDSLLADLGSDTANVLLTFARIWVTIATGEIRSKDDAADWALSRVAARDRPVLELARSVYLGSADDRWDGLEADVRRHAEHVIREIRRLAADGAAR